MEAKDKTWFTGLRGSTKSVSGWVEWIGLSALLGMVVVALIDVIGSKGFQWPLPGSTEITGFLQLVAIAAGLAWSEIDGRHIRVGFLLEKLSERGKAALKLFGYVLGLGLFIIISWTVFGYGLRLFSSGTTTLLLGIAHYPFAFWISLCCIPLCCVIIVELLSTIYKILK